MTVPGGDENDARAAQEPPSGGEAPQRPEPGHDTAPQPAEQPPPTDQPSPPPASQDSPYQYGSPAPSDAQAGWAAAPDPAAQGHGPAPQQPAPSAAPTGMTPEELRAKVSGLGLVNPLPALAVGAAGYLAAFVVAVVGLVLGVVAVAISGIGNPVEAGLDTVDLSPSEQLSGFASAVRAPFQLVAMGALGSLGFGASYEGTTVRASIRFLPGVITLAMVLVSFVGGRFVQKRQRAGQIGIWASALLAGLGVALFTVLSALILAQPVPIEEGFSLRLHAAGADSFFGALLLVALPLALGRISVRARPTWWPLVSDLPAGLKLAATHSLLLSVLGLVAVTVGTTLQALVNGEMPPMLVGLLLLPLIGGQVLAFLTGLPMLSAATASFRGSGDVSSLMGSMGGTVRATIFELPWYVWLIGLLLGLLTLLVSSLLWQHQRRVVPNNVVALAASWIALPLTYLAGGIVLLLLAHVSGSVQMTGGFMDGTQRGSVSAGLAGWTPLLALLAGVIVEVLSRFVAPFLTPLLPSAALSWFRRPLTAPSVAVTAAASGAAASGTAAGATVAAASTAPAPDRAGAAEGPAVQADGASLPAPSDTLGSASSGGIPPTAPGAYDTVPLGATAGALAGASDQQTAGEGAPEPRRPMSRGLRRALIGGGIALGAVLLLVIGLTVAYNVISGSRYAPEKQVEAYLTALEEGDASSAVEIAPPNVPTAEQALLTDAVAGATEDRIDSHRITDVDTSGDTVHVTAAITQDGVTSDQTFTLTRDGRTDVVFPNWRMGTVEYPAIMVFIAEGVTSLDVNGQEIPVEDLEVTDQMAMLSVIPGDYTVTVPEISEFVSAVPSEVFVSADPEGWYELYATPYFELNETGVQEVQSQVDAALDECATSTDAEPEGCPFSAFTFGEVADSGSWTIDEYPVVTVEQGEEGWYIDSLNTPGQATYSYQQEGWSEDDEPTDETDQSSVYISGTATLEEDGTLTVDISEDSVW